MQGTTLGIRKRGRPRTGWLNNVQNWTELSGCQLEGAAKDRNLWQRIRWSTLDTRMTEDKTRQKDLTYKISHDIVICEN